MLHIIQVVVSGIAEIPHLFVDEVEAESAYVEGARKQWPQRYAAYCTQNDISQESLASAQSFIKSFDAAEKSIINHWIVNPEDIGLDTLNLHVLGGESIQSRRRQILSLSEDMERKTAALKKNLAELMDTCAGLVEQVNDFDVPPTDDHQPVCTMDREPETAFSPPPQEKSALRDEKHTTAEWQQFVVTIRNMFGGGQNECPLFTRHDWRQEVYGNTTSLEYWEWAAANIDTCMEKARNSGYAVSVDEDQQGRYLFHTPDGIGSEKSYPSEVEAWCHASFHLDLEDIGL